MPTTGCGRDREVAPTSVGPTNYIKAGGQGISIALVIHSLDPTLQIDMKIVVMSIILSAAVSVNGVAQEYTQWGLPEGAKIRIGKGAMRDFAYSPDGTRFAIASSIGIWLYDTATLEEVALLTKHTGEVVCIAYSPDGSLLASGSDDTTVHVWDAKTGEQKYPPLPHTRDIESVEFSPDGRELASATHLQVEIWDAKTGVKKRTLKGQTGGVTCMAFSPDGNLLAVACGGKAVELWDVKAGYEPCGINVYGREAKSLAFSPTGNLLASADTDCRLRLWEIDPWKLRWTGSEYLNLVRSVAFTADGIRVIAGSVENITLWDVTTGRLHRRLRGPTGGVVSVVRSPDGGTIAGASSNMIVRFWDATSGIQLRSLAWMERHFGSAAFSPDGRTLAIGGGRNVRRWDAKSGEPLRTLSGNEDWVYSLAFNRDGSLIAVGGKGKIVIRDAGTGKRVREIPGHEEQSPSLAFSPAGRTLAVGIGQNVHLWDAESEKHLQTLNGHRDFATYLAFSRDGGLIASGGKKEVSLWDVKTGKHLRRLVGFKEDVKRIAFGGNAKTLFTVTPKELRIWDTDTWEYRHISTGIRSWDAGARFSPDGGLLALWNSQGIHLWNAATREYLKTFTGDSSEINNVVISPNRRMLVAVSNRGSVLVWEITPPSAANSTVSLAPSPVPSPSVGEKLTLSLNIENGEDVSGYQATINFDPATLRYVEGTAGDYLSEGVIFVPPVVEENGLTLGAALDGTGNGDGTLATVTFEVVAPKTSMVTLSEASLVAPNAERTYPRLVDAQVVGASRGIGDIDGDGVVGILDLLKVATSRSDPGEIDADANEDGVVDITDLFQAVMNFEVAASKREAYLAAQAILTSTDVAEWLEQPQRSDCADASLKRDIRAFRHQIAVSIPNETAMFANYPNPFNHGTWIPYQIAYQSKSLYKSPVHIRIYDTNGTQVRHLDVGSRTSGYYVGRSRAAYWDGRDDSGEPVASGTYLYELFMADGTVSLKMDVAR